MAEKWLVNIAGCKCGNSHAAILASRSRPSKDSETWLYKYKCPVLQEQRSKGEKSVTVIRAANESDTQTGEAKPTKAKRAPRTTAAPSANDGGAAASGSATIVQGGAGNDRITINEAPPAPRARGRDGAAPRGGSTMTTTAHGCKPMAAMTLHGKPIMDICDAELIPIAQGFVDALLDHARAQIPGFNLVAAADKKGGATMESCCQEGGVNIGRELFRVFTEEMLRRRMGPATWLAAMPAELALAHVSGALQTLPAGQAPTTQTPAGGPPATRAPGQGPAGNDSTDTAIGDGIVSIWTRLTGAASGAAIGGRFGAPGAIIGALIGSLFPELLGAGEDVVQSVAETVSGPPQIPVNPAGEVVPNAAPVSAGGVPQPVAPPADANGQLRLVNSQRAIAPAGAPAGGSGWNVGLNVGPLGVNLGIPSRMA